MQRAETFQRYIPKSEVEALKAEMPGPTVQKEKAQPAVPDAGATKC
jgi:hypothetical protein